MTFLLAILLLQPAPAEAHPQIPCWAEERSGSRPGGPSRQFRFFSTEDEPVEARITHHRELLYRGEALEQVYEFLDYRFPARPKIRARVYLHDPGTVMVAVDGVTEPMSLARFQGAAGEPLLCYLQKRFYVIEAPAGDAGYRPIWQAEPTAEE